MRCLALADALHGQGCNCIFVCRELTESLAALVESRGHVVRMLGRAKGNNTGNLTHSSWLGATQEVDAVQTREALQDELVNWLIVDHYAIDWHWQRAMRDLAGHILVIDDLADRTHDCDVLLDQNFHPDEPARYRQEVPDHCHVLLGPRYALLREEFRHVRAGVGPRNGDVQRLLVFLGGADADDLTTAALQALTLLARSDLHVDVVIGAAQPNREVIANLCKERGYALHVQTSRMAQLMGQADLAVGAGGSATWERCSVGLPSLTIAVAQNQLALVRNAALHGLIYAPTLESCEPVALARHLRGLLENPNLLAAMSRNGWRLVDGLGVQRVLRAMGVSRLVLRHATADDDRIVFDWRNHPSVRAVSRSQEPLDWESHCAWFRRVLGDSNRPLLIGTIDGLPVGVVRFDISGDRAEVSIYKDPDRDRPGVGADLLAAGERWLRRHRGDVRFVDAEVAGFNSASHRLFDGAGYRISMSQYSKKLHDDVSQSTTH